MKNPSISISGAVGDALLHLQALSEDRSLQEVIDRGTAGIPFLQLVAVATDHVLHAVDADSDSRTSSQQSMDVTDRSLAVIQAALVSVAGSTPYRTSLSARAGFVQFLDELETAADDLRNDRDLSKLLLLVESLERELGEAKLTN